jgi:hypothetical protein
LTTKAISVAIVRNRSTSIIRGRGLELKKSDVVLDRVGKSCEKLVKLWLLQLQKRSWGNLKRKLKKYKSKK